MPSGHARGACAGLDQSGCDGIIVRGARDMGLMPILSCGFVRVTLRVTSSQLRKVAVGRPFV